jgi:hypothetical protein
MIVPLERRALRTQPAALLVIVAIAGAWWLFVSSGTVRYATASATCDARAL